MSKPAGITWDEYVYRQPDALLELRQRREEFSEVMRYRTLEALLESRLDEDRYFVEAEGWMVFVSGSGWRMDEEEMKRVRTALRRQGIGDESVGVICHPRRLPGFDDPSELAEEAEYRVSVRLWRNEMVDDTIECMAVVRNEE